MRKDRVTNTRFAILVSCLCCIHLNDGGTGGSTGTRYYIPVPGTPYTSEEPGNGMRVPAYR